VAFVADDVPDNVRHIEELVEAARHADEDLARIREGAVPAGDPDPYRKPPGDEDE
jgi:ribosome-binding factor A